MKKYKLLLVLFSLGFLSTPVMAIDYLSRPNYKDYPNPYVIENEKESNPIHKEMGSWSVTCNRNNVEIFDSINGNKISEAKYLEDFWVVDKKGNYLSIISKNKEMKDKKGWSEIKNFILTNAAIRDQLTNVYYKGFIKVKLDGNDNNNTDVIRFRDQPGNTFNYLTKENEVDRVSNLFYYIYAVYSSAQEFDYLNPKHFKDAEYFLLGQTPTVSSDDIQAGKIVGWIPNEGLVLWDTRQALEKVSNRTKENFVAHIFPDRKILNMFFNETLEKRNNILTKLQDNIVLDKGEGPPPDGQTLRYINLDKPDNIINQSNGQIIGRSSFVGYTGQSNEADNINSNFKNEGNIHKTLADFMEGSNYLEMFFLIDATSSMGPCLESAATISKAISTRLSDKNNTKISVYGSIYRDKVDGEKLWYEECHSNDPREVSEFFFNAKEFSSQNDDYEEDLFNAINMSVDKWKIKGFKNELSTRILFILSDAGDNGRGNITLEDCVNNECSDGKKSLVKKLRENNILPIAIKMQHDPQNASGIKMEKEIQAMELFSEQMKELMENMFSNSDAKMIYSVPKSENGEVSKDNTTKIFFDDLIPAIIEHVEKLKNDLPLIKRGKKRILDSYCEDGFKNAPGLKEGCKQTNSIEELELFIKKIDKSGTEHYNSLSIGLPLAKLKQMQNTKPLLASIVFKHPELGFSQGYMAYKNDDSFIAKPVLLLSEIELVRIMESLRNLPRNCSSGENYDHLIQAMATIIGELLNYPPGVKIPEEKLRDSLSLSVESANSYIGTDGIVEKLCSDEKKWSAFRNNLDLLIDDIKNNIYSTKQNPRLYRDIYNAKYYWWRTEELFPLPK